MRHLSVILFTFIIILSSCDFGWRVGMHTDKETQISIIRYDRIFDDYIKTGNFSFIQKLNTENSDETRILVEKVLKMGSIENPNLGKEILSYYRTKDLQQLSRDIKIQFGNIEWLESQLSTAFSKLKEECPKFKVPQIYTQNAAFNQSIIVSDSLLGISLDKYMGADYPLYTKCFSEFQKRSMTPSRIVPDCLSFYIASQYPLNIESPNLLDKIIYIGKIQWIVANVTNTSCYKVLNLPKADEKWAKENERKVWKSLVKNKLLTSTDSATIHSIIYYSDNKPYLNCKMYKHIGLWIGVQIIKSFMTNHPDYTINELLINNNTRKILNQSGYDKH